MAEKGSTIDEIYADLVFQSSSYWRMAEKLMILEQSADGVECFNPHHTGEWLKRNVTFSKKCTKAKVSILIILANG